jgi:TonB family protein
MSRNFVRICFFTALLFLAQDVFAQKSGKIVSASSVSSESISTSQCKDLRLGQILTLPSPKYPTEARNEKIGGKVEVTVKIDENGNVSEVEKVEGNRVLQGAAIEAAMKAKFVPTLCDGKKARVSGTIVFNFYPYPSSDKFFTPTKIEEFDDVKKDSEFYPAILDLTENYKIAFGYADARFHAEALLTRGDFAHFLRLTLEMLTERAKFINKTPAELNLFSAYNPHGIASIGKIKDLKSKQPFYDSVKILLQNFDIAMVDGNSEFRGGATLTQNELLEIWTKIFGAEAIPINFQRTENYEKTLLRGDFALFLNESLGVLTYKLLP